MYTYLHTLPSVIFKIIDLYDPHYILLCGYGALPLIHIGNTIIESSAAINCYICIQFLINTDTYVEVVGDVYTLFDLHTRDIIAYSRCLTNPEPIYERQDRRFTSRGRLYK